MPARADPKAHRARSVARLAAVQALYQMETAGTGAEAVIREFAEHRFDRDIDGASLAPADEAYFAELVRGVVAAQKRLDVAIRRRLAKGWRLERVDATLRALLRVAAFELVGEGPPAPVVIDEYVEIAKSFFDGPEPGFVNAALDAIARDERDA
ncbi:MAG TPA: transcription antitermination factor NusB [Caulobacteraceae bacterium]|nr:transcription antitermination factor NusB [Caulobacteraceae bacterium]